MNIDRIIRDVETRLAGMDERLRSEVVDALKEAIARERRGLDPQLTVEAERERRQQAEELRGALEAIHRPLSPEETLEEVLKQLGRVVALDFAAVAGLEPGGVFRVLAVRGAEGGGLVGSAMAGPFLDAVRDERRPAYIRDAEVEEAALPLPGAPALRSWVLLPLLLEGDVVGLLLAGRQALDPLTKEELLRARAVAFWAAAALRRGQLLEQVRRYAALLEQVVDVDHRVFRGDHPAAIAQVILEGACRIGSYRGGLLVLQTPHGPSIAAAVGEPFAGLVGRSAPPDLAATVVRRLPAARMLEVAESLGTVLPAEQTSLVPLATAEAYFGCLVLLDPSGEAPDDRPMEAYASRAAVAWRYASLHQARS
jgi:hypothetical protein